MKIVTAEEMREIDRLTSERLGVPSLTLMENAGSAVAEFALRSYPDARRFGVICGKGNNGGDGFVVARKLHESAREVRLLVLASPGELKGDAAVNFGKLPGRASGPPVTIFEGWEPSRSGPVFHSEVLIDAVLGSGFRPPVHGVYAEAIQRINASRAPVVAVDIPSGSDSDAMGEQAGPVARASAIVTFTAPRPAHIFGNLTSGPIVVAPIGSPDEAVQSSLKLNVTTPRDIAGLIGRRPRDSNKGMYGHVLVAGGSLGKTGAAVMAGFSALRTGAGLVTVAAPRSTLATVAGFHPELMTEPLAETEAGTIAEGAFDEFRRLAEGKTVLAIGPGISRHASTAEFVRRAVETAEAPVVLDADGLNAFEGRGKDLARSRAEGGLGQARGGMRVLTPHPGEMARLTGLSIREIQRDRVQVARRFAEEHQLILVLKGDRTIVADSTGEAWVNTTGNPGMATGGTGDILTGMVGGLLAQNPEHRLPAVLAAVYLHGLAGDLARETMGEHSLVATDLLTALPEAFRRVRREAAEKSVTVANRRHAFS